MHEIVSPRCVERNIVERDKLVSRLSPAFDVPDKLPSLCDPPHRPKPSRAGNGAITMQARAAHRTFAIPEHDQSVASLPEKRVLQIRGMAPKAIPGLSSLPALD